MAHVDNVRRHFPAVRTSTYLNTGSFGAIPDVAAEKMKECIELVTREGRLQGYWQQLSQVHSAVVEQLVNLFGVPESTIALTDSTTHGINIVLWGLSLQPGDEIVYSSTEHLGGILPVFAQKMRRGVTLKKFTVHRNPDQTIASLKSVLTRRTRLVVCTHVSYETGQVLPVARIAEQAHAADALCLVDGAQGAGADFIDLGASLIDFYALPGQKWLCGPDGVGALYVRPEAHSVLEPTYVGGGTLHPAHPHTLEGYFLPKDTARRYEHAHAGLVNWIGWLESLKFARVQVGWDYVFSRVQGLSGTLIEQLLDLPTVDVLTPRESRAGIVSFRMRGVPAERIVHAASERNVSVRSVAHMDVVRVSTGYYNAEDDIDRLMAILNRTDL